MTLNECIAECERLARVAEPLKQTEVYKYNKQLADWLRELQIHREIHDVLLQLLVDSDLDICCEDLTDNEEEQKICEENCNNKTKGCWVRWAKLKASEVNADE